MSQQKNEAKIANGQGTSGDEQPVLTTRPGHQDQSTGALDPAGRAQEVHSSANLHSFLYSGGEIDMTGGTMSRKSWPLVLFLAGLASAMAELPGITTSQAVGQDKSPPRPSTEECLKLLKDGNARYASDKRRFAHLDRSRIAETAAAQHPFATILGCSDSRAPVEHIFDAGIGDLFVVRVAGNVCSDHESGSIEYAVNHLKTPLVVIVGHTRCGAITAVVEHADTEGKFSHLSEHIIPAFWEAQMERPGLGHDDLITESVRHNVRRAMADLINGSPLVRSQIKSGDLKVVGAVYDLKTGRVEWLSEKAAQSSGP
jgi:carbonic anhydrase